jgi:hypothetical protein
MAISAICIPQTDNGLWLTFGAVSKVRVVDAFKVVTVCAAYGLGPWYRKIVYAVYAPGATRYVSFRPQPYRPAQRTLCFFVEICRNIAFIYFSASQRDNGLNYKCVCTGFAIDPAFDVIFIKRCSYLISRDRKVSNCDINRIIKN